MKIKEIEIKLLQKLPIYYQFSKIGEFSKEEVELIKTEITFISIESLNEPMFFPFGYYKPISKI